MKLQVLQCGYPRSGNYLLFRIVSGILRQNRLYRSFVGDSGLGVLTDQFCADCKRFPEENELDDLRYLKDDWCLRFGHPDRTAVRISPELLLQWSSFLWTHESPSRVLSSPFNRVSHKIYLVRDGRDAVNSFLHFLTQPLSLKLAPDYRINSVSTLYQNLELFEKRVREWREHVISYLEHREAFLLVRFEDLIAEKDRMIRVLSEYLGLSVDAQELLSSTSFDATKRLAPEHLRSGKKGNWSLFFQKEHTEIFQQVAGQLLPELGYRMT